MDVGALCHEALDGVKDPVVILDASDRVVYANSAFAEMVARESLEGEDFARLAPEAAPILARFRSGDLSDPTPLELVGDDGSRVLVDARFAASRRPGFMVGHLSRLATDDQMIRAIVDNIPAIVWLKDLEGRYLHVNPFAARLMGMPVDAIQGKLDADLFPPEVVEQWREREARVRERNAPFHAEDSFETAHGKQVYLASVIPIHDASGRLVAYGGISTDISELRRAEEQREEIRIEMIRAQERALQELSSPIVPLWDRVVAVPLIGTIDTVRASVIMQALLEAVAAEPVTVVILDLTGVPVVDSTVAQGLLRSADAVKLLGAEVVVTGIRPEVAQTVVRMGADFSHFTIRRTLKEGLRHALCRVRGPEAVQSGAAAARGTAPAPAANTGAAVARGTAPAPAGESAAAAGDGT